MKKIYNIILVVFLLLFCITLLYPLKLYFRTGQGTWIHTGPDKRNGKVSEGSWYREYQIVGDKIYIDAYHLNCKGTQGICYERTDEYIEIFDFSNPESGPPDFEADGIYYE